MPNELTVSCLVSYTTFCLDFLIFPQKIRMPTINITVTGKVQGVWFRAGTRNRARELGITGTVCNQPDGSVFIEAEGSEEQLKELINWCKVGTPHARVDEVKVKGSINKHFEDFNILR